MKYYIDNDMRCIVAIDNPSKKKKKSRTKKPKIKGTLYDTIDDALKHYDYCIYRVYKSRNVKTKNMVNPYYSSLSSSPKTDHTNYNTTSIYKYDSELEETVGTFLYTNNIKFCTQYDTLKCVNPATHRVLPYDFELLDYKVIIEVQGSQHYIIDDKYNTTNAKLKYQIYKDNIKRSYAKSKGYKYIELDSDCINSGKFKRVINRAIGGNYGK